MAAAPADPAEPVAAGEGDVVAHPQRLPERPVRGQGQQACGQTGVACGFGCVQDTGHRGGRNVEQSGGNGEFGLLRAAHLAVIQSQVGQGDQEPAMS